MTHIEAMKQALEALEAIGSQYICRATHHTKAQQHGGFETCPNELTHEAAITALREALAQPPVAKPHEQEPVDEQAIFEGWIARNRPSGDGDSVQREWEASGEYADLYTSPPQRKPLTDKEIGVLWFEANDQDNSMVKHFARAIEAAHGIKGQP